MNIIDSGKFAFVGLLPNVYYKFSLVFTSVTDVDEYVSELKLLCFLSLTNSPPPQHSKVFYTFNSTLKR